MYRKSMRSALEEARAYSAVNEVKVSKGDKTLNISKKDVEVYQAKGWSLQEASMKRLLQALQDKLSDEGGAAGFDDLKKTAKSMGVNLTPAMLKDVPGIKQHRDGDYILENKSSELINLYQIKNKTPEIEARIAKLEKELKVIKREETELEEAKTAGGALAQGHLETMTDQRFKEFYGMTKDEYIKKHGDPRKEELDESLDVRYDTKKQGWFDRQGKRRYLGKMATNALMKKALDKAIRTGDFINPFKLKHGQKPEETELEEAKTPVKMITIRNGAKILADKDGTGNIYTNKTQAQNAANSFMKQHKGVEADAYQSPFHNRFHVRIKKLSTSIKPIFSDITKEELEENFKNFTKADFAKLEADNEHGEAAEKLVQKFRTAQEKSTINDINRRHAKTGYISGTDFRLRTMIVNRYYSRLK